MLLVSAGSPFYSARVGWRAPDTAPRPLGPGDRVSARKNVFREENARAGRKTPRFRRGKRGKRRVFLAAIGRFPRRRRAPGGRGSPRSAEASGPGLRLGATPVGVPTDSGAKRGRRLTQARRAPNSAGSGPRPPPAGWRSVQRRDFRAASGGGGSAQPEVGGCEAAAQATHVVHVP